MRTTITITTKTLEGCVKDTVLSLATLSSSLPSSVKKSRLVGHRHLRFLEIKKFVYTSPLKIVKKELKWVPVEYLKSIFFPKNIPKRNLQFPLSY